MNSSNSTAPQPQDATRFTPRKGMTSEQIKTTVAAALAEATLEEKVTMMSGQGFFQAMAEDNRVWGTRPYRAGGGIERLGVPAFYFTDGPRGVTRDSATCFPCTMARGATFDDALERRVGEAMGAEARALGCNLSGAVCINLLRHPAWGRAQETYGEDPYHLGMMGTAMGLGIQTHNVCATVKHFALNSAENSRFKVDIQVDPRTLREVYLPHFKHALKAGVASVMSAYNKVNGVYCGEHRELLTGILRDEWGFEGWVHSDWVRGVHTPMAATAGLDVENPEPLIWGPKLVAAVKEGVVEMEVIDRACTRVLTTLYHFAAAEDPQPDYPVADVAGAKHVALALEVAEKSAVLLENDGTLPLDRAKVKTLAVLGRLAALENTGDHGSSRVRPPYVVTALEGLRRHLDASAEIRTADESDLDAARTAAAQADAIVVVAGLTREQEGEYIIGGDIALGEGRKAVGLEASLGGDRDTLDLPDEQVALIEAAIASGKPVIVVVIAGSAIMMEGFTGRVGAILQTFYSGMEGGTALARLLFGEVSPSGKLPFTVAQNTADYPFFDKDAEVLIYGPYHGYTLLDQSGAQPRYAFGHGLSYSRFSYHDLKVASSEDEVQVTVSVRNEGEVAADEVAQLYVGFPGDLVERPAKLLKGFSRVSLAPGETRVVQFTVAKDDLRFWDAPTRQWTFEPGVHRFHVGGSSAKSALTTAEFDL